MDKDVYYDIPVFKSLPEKIETSKVTFDKLNKISIVDMYQKEPFSNNFNYYIYFYIIMFIFIFLYFLYFF
jgi:hypothetical protein